MSVKCIRINLLLIVMIKLAYKDNTLILVSVYTKAGKLQIQITFIT
jgi:hypothetical protein